MSFPGIGITGVLVLKLDLRAGGRGGIEAKLGVLTLSEKRAQF